MDVTWQDYEKSVGGNRSRSKFADASDFVGWYGYQAKYRAGIQANDAYRFYLAYHEGIGGYQRGTYHQKTWLINTAKRVQGSATAYQAQLPHCPKPKRWFLF